MKWAKDGATWPYANHSRFVLCKPHRWHVQDVGNGHVILLIHGAGGATHSWQHLIPYLSAYRVIAIDLPGQGFTALGAQQRCGLNTMAEDILALLAAENIQPHAIIGHSAGAAIALRMAEVMPDPPRIIGINAALDTFQGVAGVLFPLLAKTIAAMPLAANIFSATASHGNRVDKIIKGTGSSLPDSDLTYYRRLVADPEHVNATLKMMAQWQLEPLLDRLPRNPAHALLIASDRDTAVPPATSQKAAARMPNASHLILKGLGHLAHEEDASTVATAILDWL